VKPSATAFDRPYLFESLQFAIWTIDPASGYPRTATVGLTVFAHMITFIMFESARPDYITPSNFLFDTRMEEVFSCHPDDG
jgi:hypothetical protein